MVRRLLVCVGALAVVGLSAAALVHWRGNEQAGYTVALTGTPTQLAVDDTLHRAFVYTMPNGNLSVIDTRTGALLQVLTAAATHVGVVPAWLALDRRAHHLFVSSGNGKLYMLDTRSGVLLRTIPTAESGLQQVVVDEMHGRGFVGYDDGTVVTEFDSRSGAVLRQVATCTGPSTLGISGSTGRLFAHCNDGYTVTVDTQSGRIVGTAATVGLGSAVLVDERRGRVFETSCNNGVSRLLDARTGALLRTWSFAMVATVDPGTAGIVGARQAGGCKPGKGDLLRVDERAGTVASPSEGADNALATLINPRTGHLLLASAGKLDSAGNPVGSGIISVLDLNGGFVRKRVEVGIMPWQMDLDRQANRLIVLNGYAPFPQECACTSSLLAVHEGWWARSVRTLKETFGWLPFSAPSPPPPTAQQGTVTLLDSAQL